MNKPQPPTPITKLSTNIIKMEDGVVYYKKFPEWVHEKYYEVIKGHCQICNKKIFYREMEIHRIIRGYRGGLYTLCKLDHPKQNCKFLCSDCHKNVHTGENNRK
jgi:5-methylcytosine-specific restriction endonuclease McrA